MTASAVASREGTRLSVSDSNELKIEQRASHLSELLHTLYKQIIAAVRPKAPLLYAKLENACANSPPPFKHFWMSENGWGRPLARFG